MALFRSASSKISTGDLPPSSSVTFLRLPSPSLHDLLADLGRSGEGDLLDIGVRGDRRAGGVAVTGHQVDDALGHPGLGQEPVSSSAESGVSSAGLTTLLQPAASAARAWRRS